MVGKIDDQEQEIIFKFDGVDFGDSYSEGRRDERQPEVELSFRREVKA